MGHRRVTLRGTLEIMLADPFMLKKTLGEGGGLVTGQSLCFFFNYYSQESIIVSVIATQHLLN